MTSEQKTKTSKKTGEPDWRVWGEGVVEHRSNWKLRVPPTTGILLASVAAFYALSKCVESSAIGLAWGVLLGLAIVVGVVAWIHKCRDP